MDKQFSKLENGYFNTLGKTLHQPILMLLMLAIAIVALVQLLKKCLAVPKEDRGNFFILMNAQEGLVSKTTKNLEKIESILMPYRESGKSIAFWLEHGFGGNAGIPVGSADWDERISVHFRSW